MSLAIAAEEAATVDVEQRAGAGLLRLRGLLQRAARARKTEPLRPVSDVDSPSARSRTCLPTCRYLGSVPEYAVAEPPVELADTEANEDAYTRVSTEPSLAGDEIILVDLLLTMLERGASDLHITAGARTGDPQSMASSARWTSSPS